MKKINSNINYTDNIYYICRTILIIGLPLTIISGLVLSHLSIRSSAYSSSTDNVSLTLPSACTISASVVEQHNATLVNGQKEDNIGNTKINAYCNDNNGYFIYAIGSSGDIDGNTDLISSVNNDYNIHTGIYIIGNTNSSWAMKLSSNNGTYAPRIVDGYDNYSEIPSTDTIVAYRTSGTSMDLNTDLTGSYFNTTYQIYANSIQPAGTYLGKVKYTMTHPYDANQLTTIEKAFDIAGKDKVTVTDPVTGITGSYYKMQDMTSRVCDITNVYNESSQTQLVDIRDNKLYWIAKLDDDHCWMTQNLDLDIVANSAFSSNTTDLNVIYDSAKEKYPEYNNGYSNANNIIYWSPTLSTISFSGTGKVSGWNNSTTAPYSANKTDNHDTGHASPGNWYNFTAAIASNNSSTLADNTLNDISKNPQNSICPKNWRLPTMSSMPETIAGSTNEFPRLNYLYNNGDTMIDNLISAPLFFLNNTGTIWDGSYHSSSGQYRTSTINGSNRVYSMQISDSLSFPSQNVGHVGNNIRCVAR